MRNIIRIYKGGLIFCEKVIQDYIRNIIMLMINNIGSKTPKKYKIKNENNLGHSTRKKLEYFFPFEKEKKVSCFEPCFQSRIEVLFS